jgi:hypothetical protein
MNGTRVYDKGIHELEPGEYIKGPKGDWYARTPNGQLGNLGGHQVTEHHDGSITVSPSILVTGGESNKRYHGYLRAGVWETLSDSTP